MRPVNPDGRPLPPGWHEHYDASKSTWYYICTNFKPPQVSTTHPLGALPQFSSRPSSIPNGTSYDGPSFPRAEAPRYAQDPSPPPSAVQPKASTLSLAQQLYASASKPSQAAVSSPPVTSSSIPTPPLSPPLGFALSTRPMLPSPSLPHTNSPHSHHSYPSTSHNPSPTSQSPHHPRHKTSSLNLHTSHAHSNSTAHPHAPHRTQSYQPAPAHNQHSAPHRASTYTAGAMSKPKGVPHLTTTLRPPGSQVHKPRTTPSLQTSQLQPQRLAVIAPVPSYPSPPNTATPAAVLNTSVQLAQPSAPPTMVYPPQPVSQNYTIQAQMTLGPQTPSYSIQQQQQQQQLQQQQQQLQQQQQQQTGAAVGQALGGFALGVTGGALSTALGVEQGNGGSIGGAIGGALVNGMFGGEETGFVSSLSDGLSNLVSQNAANNNPQPQAALQGQPGTDYQTMINTMLQQQQIQASQQQVTGMGTIAGQNNTAAEAYINAYNAQLQANAIQEAAQAQQTQALLQAAAYQQQQQLVQLQLQQQQQQQQQQQVLQQQFILQQFQQQQPAQGQQEAPLATFLTGMGQTLSAFATSSDGGDAAASGGAGVMSFLGDLVTSSSE